MINMKSIVGVSAVLLAIGWDSPARADDTAAMHDYVAEVVARNPSIRAGTLRRAAYRDEAAGTGKWSDPFVSVMVDQVPEATGGLMPMIRYSVTQMLPWPGKLRFMRDAVEHQGEGSEAELDARRLDLRLEAERAYVMLWMNAKRREINHAQRAIASTIASAALGRYGAGTGDHHEVARTQVEVNSLDVQSIDLDGERTSILAMINALRNQPSDTAMTDPADLGPPSASLSVDPLTDRAIASRPELQRMKAMQNEAGSMAALARREPYPDIMTSIWANQMMGGPPTMGAMIGFTIPIFSASRGEHLGAAFDERAQAASEDAESMRAMIRAEVAQALVKVQTATRQVDLIQTVALPKAHESFDASLAAYGAGSGDVVGLLDARRSLQDSQLMMLDARVRRALAVAELEHEIGGTL